jgi:acyl carrier protein
MTDTITERGQLLAAIGTALERVLRRQWPSLREDTRLMADLGLDSTNVLELLMELEDELGVTIDAELLQARDFDTVGTLADLVTRHRDQ